MKSVGSKRPRQSEDFSEWLENKNVEWARHKVEISTEGVVRVS